MITIHLPRTFNGQRTVAVFAGSQRVVRRVGPGRSVRVSFRGVSGTSGRGVAIAIWGQRIDGRRPHLTRVYTLCSKRGVGQFNVPPAS